MAGSKLGVILGGGALWLLGASLGLWLILAGLGVFFVTTYQNNAITNEGFTGGLLVEGFLAPHARKLLDGATLPAESHRELMAALELPPLSGKIIVFKLWDLKGNLLFTSNGTPSGGDHFPAEDIATNNPNPVAELHPDGIPDENLMVGRPVIEVYSPIFDAERKEIIAIGEIYANAGPFLTHLSQTKLTIWLAVAMTAFGLSGCLVLVVARQRDLVASLKTMSAHATQNRMLKEAADGARLQASQANEALLNRLGAELHDGPIQMLTLLMLMQSNETALQSPGPGLSQRDIIERTMADLRAISTGLVLPEIEELTLADALQMAVSRHEEITGKPVKVALSDLPAAVDQALKICCYRLVQEGLTNAERHGDPSSAQMNARVNDRWIEVKIRNSLRKDPPSHPDTGRSGGLGLQGMRMRVAVFGGTVNFETLSSGGAELTALIPLRLGLAPDQPVTTAAVSA